MIEDIGIILFPSLMDDVDSNVSRIIDSFNGVLAPNSGSVNQNMLNEILTSEDTFKENIEGINVAKDYVGIQRIFITVEPLLHTEKELAEINNISIQHSVTNVAISAWMPVDVWCYRNTLIYSEMCKKAFYKKPNISHQFEDSIGDFYKVIDESTNGINPFVCIEKKKINKFVGGLSKKLKISEPII